jgi:periplasmic protein TonB
VLVRESIRTWSIALGLSALVHFGLAGALSGQSWMTRDSRPRPLVSLPVDLVESPPQRTVREEPRPVPPPPRRAPREAPHRLPAPRPLETAQLVERPPQEVIKRAESVMDAPSAPATPVETPPPASPAPSHPTSSLSVENDRDLSRRAGPALSESRKSAMGDAPAPGSSDASTAVASAPRSGFGSSPSASSSGISSGTSTRGISQWAHPQGGYQVHPSYPASARRLGIQGTVRLRVQVLVDGRVGEIIVESSAGHSDLDEAAADAVRRWHFEPARRGAEPVATWVLLPVQFQLK